MAPTLGGTGSGGGATTTATLSGIAYRCPASTPGVSPVPASATVAAEDVAATVQVAAQARSAPDKSAPARFELAPGTQVTASPAATRGFRKIRTDDRRSGYVEDAALQVRAR